MLTLLVSEVSSNPPMDMPVMPSSMAALTISKAGRSRLVLPEVIKLDKAKRAEQVTLGRISRDSEGSPDCIKSSRRKGEKRRRTLMFIFTTTPSIVCTWSRWSDDANDSKALSNINLCFSSSVAIFEALRAEKSNLSPLVAQHILIGYQSGSHFPFSTIITLRVNLSQNESSIPVLIPTVNPNPSLARQW